ncbi:MAG: 3-keto-disaccharide hydrolase, partial [Planctomycetia bacterium]
MFASVAQADEPAPSEWRNLLDADLRQWEVFMGVPHTSVDVDWPSKSDSGKDGTPMGLGNDPLKVFSVKKIDGEDVLCVTGEIYGGLTSKQEFSDYHLSLQFKWGEKKWEPRKNDKRDSGLLLHCVGKHGAFWNVWMRSLECQIQEGDCGDFIALAGSGCNIRVRKEPGAYHPIFDPTKPLYHGTGYVTHGPSEEKPHGRWNTVEVYTLGQTTVFLVNGKPNMVLERTVQELSDGWKPLTKG